MLGGEQVISAFDVRDGKLAYVSSTHTTMRELYVGTDGRRVTNVGDAFDERSRARRGRALHRASPRTATRSTRGSCGPPASTRASAIPRS